MPTRSTEATSGGPTSRCSPNVGYASDGRVVGTLLENPVQASDGHPERGGHVERVGSFLVGRTSCTGRRVRLRCGDAGKGAASSRVCTILSLDEDLRGRLWSTFASPRALRLTPADALALPFLAQYHDQSLRNPECTALSERISKILLRISPGV